jgi:hypothetical protein
MKALFATVLLAVLSGCAATNADKAPTYYGVTCFIEDNGKQPTEWGMAKIKFQYDQTHKLIVVRQSSIMKYDQNQCIVLH